MNEFMNKIVGWQPETYYIFFKTLKCIVPPFFVVGGYNVGSRISVHTAHPPPTISLACVSYCREYFDFWTTKPQLVAVMHYIEYIIIILRRIIIIIVESIAPDDDRSLRQ